MRWKDSALDIRKSPEQSSRIPTHVKLDYFDTNQIYDANVLFRVSLDH